MRCEEGSCRTSWKPDENICCYYCEFNKDCSCVCIIYKDIDLLKEEEIKKCSFYIES